ncbi:hypothetical protein VTO42DRAFT_5232 [Malbranchea cinnamomea]
MAEEPQPAATAATAAADSVPRTPEVSKKTPEPSASEKKEEDPAKESDKPAEGETAAADEPPEKPTETIEESQPVDATAEEKPGGEAEATGAADEAAEQGPNGTPAASAKKASGKRKSVGATEQRSKKLSRKKSSARITHLDAQPGEYYFARMKGYAPWPAIICDEEMLPESILATRPVTAKQADGTYKEPYADGGKRVYDRTFPVMYLHTNEFAWVKNTDLSPLEPEKCKDVPEKGKSKALIEAYKVAAEGHDLQYFKDLLADHQRLVEEEMRAAQERAAAKEAKRAKSKRKSTAAKDEDEDIDMAASGEEAPKSAKKRKKDVESDGESEKPAKTPKTGTKLKLTTTPKTPKTAEKGKKAAESAKAAKSKGASAKKGAAKAATSDDEETAESPKEAQKSGESLEANKRKQQQVLFLRHKLQRGFLSREQEPKPEEMEAMSAHLRNLEAYDDLEVGIIRATKINKVLKGILKLNSIPREEEFNFRERCINILRKWKSLLESDVPATKEEGKEEDKGEAKEAKPTENGVEKENVNGKPEEAPADKGDGDVEMADADNAAPPKADAPESTEKPKEAEAAAAEDGAEAETAKA